MITLVYVSKEYEVDFNDKLYSVWVIGNDVTVDTIKVQRFGRDVTAIEEEEVIEYFYSNLESE